MKNHYLALLVYILSLIAVISCSIDYHEQPTSPDLSTYLITKSSIHYKQIYDDYSVSPDDLYKYLGKDKEVLDISELKDSTGKTVLYVVNFHKGGYEIVSGDKRTYPSLASSEVGFLNITEANESLSSWLRNVTHSICQLKKSDSLTVEMRHNVATWDFITRDKYIVEARSSRRYFYLIYSQTRIWYPINIGPLLSTNWGQSDFYPNDNYWNAYCPWADSTMTNEKCPVGCVAVAGGQFAYYMKDVANMDILIPDSVNCDGYIKNFTRTFSSSMSSSKIHNMPLNGLETDPEKIENARIFLAYLGHLVGMQYNTQGSGAWTESLIDVFSMWGLDTYYTDYADSIAQARLLMSIPVIARGVNLSANPPQGHAWIIDGYQKQASLRQNYYYMSDHELTAEEIESLTRSDSNSYDEWRLSDVYFYHMNWGANGFYDGWYLTDDWTMNQSSFLSDRKLLVTYNY